MAKSGKKQPRPRLSPAQLVRPDKDRPIVPTPSTPKTETQELSSLEKEYRYVVNDLKYIAIIAAVMLVLMVVAALLIV